MRSSKSFTRRRVLITGAMATAATLLAGPQRGQAAEGQRLTLDDPAAKALGYVEDASAVDVAKWPKKAGPGGADQLCSNCSLYTPQDAEWGGCSLFPGKLVKGAGWCNAWVPKA